MRFPTSGARRTLVLFLILTALASLAAACGSSAAAPAGAAAPAEGQAVGGDGSAARGGASAAPAAPGVGVTGSNGGNGGKDAAFRDDAKIIRTGSLQLDVKDVKASLRSARDTIVGMGGYVGARRQRRAGRHR